MASEEQLKDEIARLTASINQHKSNPKPRSNAYVNPNYKPPVSSSFASASSRKYVRPAGPVAPKEVVLNGVAFQSSGRSLVRKDLPAVAKPPSMADTGPRPYSGGKTRVYKPIGRVRRGRGRGRGRGNMTLTNNRRPYKSRAEAKRLKYMNKPCPRFTTTGSCSRGLTCMYQHDPAKIAICWNFLHGTCPHTSETCPLSHDPTPQRTPVCLHFQLGGCTRAQCPFPHVKLGKKEGICRDFAVLGYCEKGLECEKSHVRECPDFAETGTCGTKGCKLPHVIRANRNRKPTSTAPETTNTTQDNSETMNGQVAEGKIGDEYISLTFNESEDESSEEEDNEDDEEEMDEDMEEEEDQPISVHA